MNTTQCSKRRSVKADVRLPISVGLSIGLGTTIARDVHRALEDSLGPAGSFATGLVAAGAAAAAIAILINLVWSWWRPRDGQQQNELLG